MTNFDKYIAESTPTGVSKLDVYNSQKLLRVLDTLDGSLRSNINSGMFEDDMLKELKDIKHLLKVDVIQALQRAKDYAPTVAALTDGVASSSPFPKVDKSDLSWLTDKRITNYTTLAYNLSLIKRLWNQSKEGVQTDKFMKPPGGDSGKGLKSTYDSDVLKEFSKKNQDSGLQDSDLPDTEKIKRDAEGRNKELKDMYKKSASTLLDQFKWMATPASPYLDIVKNVWDFAKPLRKTVENEAKNLKDAGKYLLTGSADVISNAWKDAQEARQKNRGLKDASTPPVTDGDSVVTTSTPPVTDGDSVVATSTELQPESVDFPASISIDNFGDFEAWLEEWLKPMIENGHLTDLSISGSLVNLVDNSDAHLALLLHMSEALDLLVLNKAVYDAGVDRVMKDQGLLPGSTEQGVLSASTDEGLLPGSTEQGVLSASTDEGLLPEAQGVVLALPGHELSLPTPPQSLLPESTEQEAVLPAVVERGLSVRASDSDEVTTSVGVSNSDETFPAVAERASSVSVSDSDDVPVLALSERGVTSLGVEEVQASAEPVGDSVLWSSVRSKFRNRVIEDAEFEDITDSTHQQEVERDKQQGVIDSTKAMFDGLREAVDELKEENKDESDQTQELLEEVTGGKKDSPLAVFLSSLLSGFTGLFSGLASFFNPTMIAGIGALVAYFSSEGFRNFINGIGKFAWDKTKDFFDSNKRDSTTEEVGGVAGGVSRAASLGSKVAGEAAKSFDRTSKVAGRAVKIAEAGGKGTSALKAVETANKTAAALSKLSSSGLGKIAGKAGGLAGGVEFLNTGLGALGLDAEANEMNAAKNYDMFGDLDVAGLIVDDAFAKSAGLDNLTWKDYVSSAFNGASLGALAGGGVASAITAVLGAGGAVTAMSLEAREDYRAFAKEHPQAFLQMIAAKKAGVSLDRLSFRGAKGKGTDGFVKWVQDNKSEIKDAMGYSSVSKQGLYNTLMGIWYASRANPNLEIKDLPFSAVLGLVMPTVNAKPIMKKGLVSDIDVSVQPIDLPGRQGFIDNVEDALSGDFFRTDSRERAKIVRNLGEVGDDFEGHDSGYFSPTSDRIRLGNGVKKQHLGVNTEGVSNPNIVGFVNGLSGRSAVGDIVITSGLRTQEEQDEIKNRKGNKYSTGKSPHLTGRAVDLRLTPSLAGFFASREGYDYLIRNNIDPHFLWGETDIGADSHFHVQLRQPNKFNDLFYSKDGWDYYKVYAGLRRAKLRQSGASYKEDSKRMLAMSLADLKNYKAEGSEYSSFMGKPSGSTGFPFLSAEGVEGVDDVQNGSESKSGEWYSGVVSAIDSIGAVFKAQPGVSYNTGTEVGGPSAIGDPSAIGEVIPGLKTYKLPESKPSRLTTPFLNTDLLTTKDSKGATGGKGGDTVISSPSSVQVVTTNNIVNIKSNLYTKQS